ncbi:MAG: formate dehydrogenase accessory sulfurtransferase FdhD [Neisseria sp.]|nr:formate dehydrogenase accessory sulfurtransferase FdhD [Neisseria sp.]
MNSSSTPDSVNNCTVWRVGKEWKQETDHIAAETAVALVYNGISHTVLMASPERLPELAVGFSLSEGIIDRASQIFDITQRVTELGIEVELEVAAAAFARLKSRRRHLVGRSGCGLCGIDSLLAARPELPQLQRTAQVSLRHIRQALHELEQHQPLRHRTGAVHAAAYMDRHGHIVAVAEDIGRHNALDKLIGIGTHAAWDWQQGAVLMTSRAGYEIVQKAARIGIACVAAVSAPTALAVQLARQARLTLIAFARENRQSVYAYPEYLDEFPE